MSYLDAVDNHLLTRLLDLADQEGGLSVGKINAGNYGDSLLNRDLFNKLSP